MDGVSGASGDDGATPETGTVGIVVKTMDDARYDVRVSGGGSVEDLKRAIVARVGVPMDRQRLIFRGRTLGNGEALAACAVVDGATVHLVAR